MTVTLLRLLRRRGWIALLSVWLLSGGCLCYGGGEPPPEDDDDDDDDDATNNTEFPEYDVAGFYLDIGVDEGDDLYGGIVITENGRLSEWYGIDGVHQEEEWLVTLSQGQLDKLILAIDPPAWFGADIDESGEPDCVVEFRLGTESNIAIHESGSIPVEMATFYATLVEILDLYGIEDGCSG